MKEYTDHELLVQISESQRKDLNRDKLVIVILVVVLLTVAGLAVYLVPKVLDTINQVNDLVAQAQKSLNELDSLLQNLDEEDMKTLADSIDQLGSFLNSINKIFH